MKLLTTNFYSFSNEKTPILRCIRWGAVKRYTALLLWCFAILSLYFAFDIPGSLQNHMMCIFNLTNLQFSIIYSGYSWPNIVMCFIGGFLVDRVFGLKLGLIIYSGVASLGMLLFVVGGNIGNFILMVAGRFVLGIGCESALVTINNYTIVWFSGKELNMVFAIVMNIGRIGSSLVFESSEPTWNAITKSGLPKNKIMGHTLIALGSVILVSLVCSLLLAFMNPEKKEEEINKKTEKPSNPPVAKLSDVLKFPLQFWLLCFIADIYIICIYSFLGLSQTSLTTMFKVSDETANRYVSFFSFFGAALSPILGIFIDFYGRNLIYVVFAFITGIIAFTLLAFTHISPYVSMLILAISIASILSSTWALFSYIIPEHKLGTAYGVVQGIMNVLFSIGSVVAGAISTKYGPQMMEIYILVLLTACVPLVVWLCIVDLKHNKILNMSAKKRVEYIKNMNNLELVERTPGTLPNNVDPCI